MFGFIKELFERSINKAKGQTKLRMPTSLKGELTQLEEHFFPQNGKNSAQVVDLAVTYADYFLRPHIKPAIRDTNGYITEIPLQSIAGTFLDQARGLPPQSETYILRCDTPFVKKLEAIKDYLRLPDIKCAALVSVEFLKAVQLAEIYGGEVGALRPLNIPWTVRLLNKHKKPFLSEESVFAPLVRNIE